MQPNTLQATDGTQLDPKVLKVVRTVKKLESGGQPDPYKAVGDNGQAFGAYQFNEKYGRGWKSYAKEHLGDENAPMDPANQNQVVYKQFKKWKDQGATPEEIDALWNGAKKDPTTGRYSHLNQDRANKFREALLSDSTNAVSAELPNQVKQTQPTQPLQAPSEPTKPLYDKVTDFFGGRGVVDAIGGLIAKATSPKDVSKEVDMPSVGQVAGSLLQLGSLALPFKGVGMGIKAGVESMAGRGILDSMLAANKVGKVIPATEIAQKTAQATKLGKTLGTIGSGATGGYVYDVGKDIQEGKTANEALTPGLGTILGGGTAGVLHGLSSRYSPKNVVSKIAEDNRKVLTATSPGIKLMDKSTRMGKDTGEFLAKKGINLNKLVGSDYKYATQEVEQNLTKDIETLDDVLTESLGSVKNKVSLKDLEKEALKAVDNSITRRDNTVFGRQAQVKQEFANYKKTYGDNVDLPTLNQIKRGQRSLSGVFDATKPKFASDVHYQIGDVTMKKIEQEAKKAGVQGIKELNEYLGNHIDANKAVSRLRRSGQVSRGGKIGKYADATAGRIVGGALGAGGGVTTTLLGMFLGDLVSKGARGTSKFLSEGPVYNAIFKRLSKESPEVVQELLEKMKAKAPISNPIHIVDNIATSIPQNAETAQFRSPGDILIGQKGMEKVSTGILDLLRRKKLGMNVN